MEWFHIILTFVTIYLLIKSEPIQVARTTHLNNVHLNQKLARKKYVDITMDAIWDRLNENFMKMFKLVSDKYLLHT